MQRFSLLLAAVLLAAAAPNAAEQTWVGEIGDSACNMKHDSGAENVPTPPAKECVANCLRGGSKLVLLLRAEGKIFQIENQQAAGLAELAGDKVKVTGELKGADTIVVAKVEKAQ